MKRQRRDHVVTTKTIAQRSLTIRMIEKISPMMVLFSLAISE